MSDNLKVPDPGSIAWLESVVGTVRVVSEYAHGHGYSQLWRLEAGGGFLWLKLHRYPGKWAGEVHALLHWGTALGLSPAVVAHRADPPSVLMAEMPGTMASKAKLGARAEERLWREAGRFLAKLHTFTNAWFGAVTVEGAPQGQPSSDAEAFVRRSIEDRIGQGKALGLWTDNEEAFLSWAAREWTSALREAKPVAVHRDSGPRNWLTDASGRLSAVIDWEHARWDVWASDLCRPWDDLFVQKPHLASSFIEGYGGLDETQWAQLRALRLLQACGGLVWAVGVRDEAYVDLNRAALRRMMSEVAEHRNPAGFGV